MTDEWFYKHLAGIQVGEPGFEYIRIAPKPAGDLERASGKTDTVRGVVEFSWELVESPGKGRDGQGIRLDVTIPGNATATVEIPTLGAEKIRVRESGFNVWNNEDEAVVEVASGKYGFELERTGN